MRPVRRPRWRDAAIVGAVLAVLFGLVVALDYRIGGIERFGVSLERVLHGTSVDAGLPLDAVEARLTERLTHPATFDSGTEAREFGISDCIATFRRSVPKSACDEGDNGWWQTETFFDLRLLETAPFRIETREMGAWMAGETVITWKFRPEAAARLRRLERDYDALFRRVKGQHPGDVTERLRALSRETERLEDRLFETNGRRWFQCSGLTRLLPEWKGEVRFSVLNEHAPETIDLMHAYASRACPFDEAALAPQRR